jgi:hypothetical protein
MFVLCVLHSKDNQNKEVQLKYRGRKKKKNFPGEIIVIFHFCGRIVALGSTRPLTRKYQESSLEGKGGRCVGVVTLPPSCADCLEIQGVSTSWTSTGLSRDSFHLYLHSTNIFAAHISFLI